MKTEQEQIEEMRRTIYNTRRKVNGIATAGDIAEALVQAGYADVSEYKAEIERLRQEVRDTDKMARNIIEQYKNNYDNAFERLKAQEREIERLKEENKQAQIDALTKLKDSYGLYYLSAFGVKERMLADILNPMIDELKK